MKVDIKNCNNIDNGYIIIENNKLNIKYAINGTGKSTIAKALEASINKNNLKNLIPFKYRDNENLSEEFLPEIEGIEEVKSISIFNEEYVEQFTFQQEEIIQNSFDIFIKNKDYDERMNQIDILIKDIKETFSKSEELEMLINDLTELSSCFGKSKSGYSAAGSIGKGIGNGNKIDNIPAELQDYEDFLKSEVNTQWIKWQTSGNEYIDIAKKCPYCTTSIEQKKNKILSISKEYDAKTIEHLNKVISVFQRLNKYFIKETNDKIDVITHNINGITTEHKNFLLEIKSQIDVMIEKLEGLKSLGFYSLKNVEKIIEVFSKYKIDMNFFSHLHTEETVKLADKINVSLENVLTKAGILQGEVNKQNKNIEKTINKHKDDINSFLKYAGYKYYIDIKVDQDEKYKMKLKHFEYSKALDKADAYLSFGERNAFSLILFMFDSLKKDNDLIILDDPISSFDKNKKFAILNRLFSGADSFQNKTVLMLTHDFEPIIDILYNLPRKFNPKPKVSFLSIHNNNLKETEVKREDIKTFLEISTENIETLKENINKLIYLRRLYEITMDKSEAYNLISNLLHKRVNPIIRINEELSEEKWRDMTLEEINKAQEEIESKIEGFDYKKILNDLLNQKKMIDLYNSASNNYEKLQLYRILYCDSEDFSCNEVVRKFINETFHIENDYIMQLNPCKYEIVPQYIIDECDKEINDF